MTTIRYAGTDYASHPGETVLETLEREGRRIPSACRSGVCQSCLMRARVGSLPPAAQAGLKDTLRAQGYFLACRCRPETALEVELPDGDAVGDTAVRLSEIELLSPSVMRVVLEPESAFKYRRGQFINLVRDDGIRRSYSLTGSGQGTLELHVRHLPGGAMSDWLMRSRGEARRMRVQGPLGNCFYLPGRLEQPLLLIGTGTGLAPLYGIVCDALESGHCGPIHLYHGARTAPGLYFVDRLRELAAENTNLHYTPCVLEADGSAAPPETEFGAVDQIGFAAHPDLKGWRGFFCGDPELVSRLRKRAYLAGAKLDDLHADAFLPAQTPAAPAPG